MSKDKNKLDFSDMDAVFDFVQIDAPSELSLKQSQLTRERFLNPEFKKAWYEKNVANRNDEEYSKKLSNGLRKWHANNPGAVKERKSTPEAREKARQATLKTMEDGKWTMPSFAGQTHTEEVRKIISETHSGREKPLEGNKKISKHFKGKKKNPSAIAKASKALSGRTMNRGRRVMTPIGEFDKITLAAKAYGVTDMAIKNKIVNPKHPDYYFLDDINSLGALKVHTDKGIFNNSREAATAYNISDNGMKYRINSDKWPDFYYLDERQNFESPQIKD